MMRLVMIGAPVTSVRTPPLLEARLRELGTAASIEVRHLEPEALTGFMAATARDEALDGLLVTMPHKQAVMPFLGRLTETARRAGSVNTVKRIAGLGLVGAQFDGIALARALAARGIRLADSRVLLAGLGGAGAAIAWALAQGRCRELALFDRAPERAAALTHAGLGVAVERLEGPYDVLVNATPLGMKLDDPSPFPPALLETARLVADIVADPPQTALAGLATARGLPLVSGRDMVVSQIAPIADWLLSEQLEQ